MRKSTLKLHEICSSCEYVNTQANKYYLIEAKYFLDVYGTMEWKKAKE